jgi:hypothetical protein
MLRSRRLLAILLAAAFTSLAGTTAVRADEPKAADPKAAERVVPALASDEDAAAAVATFKEEFKAKGLKGAERTSQRDWAMSKLAKVQHATVVEALADVVRSSDARLRTLGVLWLAEQKALPGPAGRVTVAALEKNRKDFMFVFSALDTIGSLRYLGAGDALRDYMKGDIFVFKKAAIVAAGETRDIRLLPDLLRLLGVDSKGDDSSQAVVTSEGASWDGAEASVDTGTPGDADQKAAEAAVAAQLAANEAGAGGGGGGGGPGGASGGGGGETRGKGGASRSIKELAPHVLGAVKKITGQNFATAQSIVKWLGENREWVAKERARITALAKSQ